MADPAQTTDALTIVGAIAAALGGGAGLIAAVKAVAAWFSSLVTNCQADSKLARDQFLAANTEARKDFLGALDRLDKRADALQDIATSVKTILTERGIPGPEKHS